MIDFYDLSHWNDETAAQLASKDRIVAHKITEGSTYIDKAFFQRLPLYKNIPVIAYHFLRADLHTAEEKEMSNYIAAIRRANRSLIMALDFEKPYCNNTRFHFDYVMRCIEYLRTHTGKEPYIYINESQLTVAKNLGYNFPWIWCAKWSKTPPRHECGIWQYTNKPLDRNHFMLDDISMLTRHSVEVK